MLDETTTLMDLRKRVAKFVNERGWERYHNPKDVAISMSIEAGELLELFQWKREEEIDTSDVRLRRALEDELADVIIYALSLANVASIDLSSSILRKIEKNEERYPVGERMTRWES